MIAEGRRLALFSEVRRALLVMLLYFCEFFRMIDGLGP